ncbi:hypothetical protein ABZ410_17155 [Streptomyces cinnamoneus]|uniref:hypothetical protein n=2 Tax=Streptomyces cinnamoneus TaxID=53446 RepID=UPI0033FD04B6
MPGTLQETLQAFAYGMRIAPMTGTGTPTSLRLVPPPEFLMNRTPAVQDIVPGSLDGSVDIQATQSLGTVLGDLTGSAPVAAGVPGNLLNVGVDVRWRVLDQQGHVMPGVAWSLTPATAPGVPSSEGQGGEIHVPLGRGMDVFLPLVFVEANLDRPTAPLVRVEADVRVYAGGSLSPWSGWASSDWTTLPPVMVPAIPVPTLLVLFWDDTLKGAAIIFVPATSPVAKSTVLTQLRDLIGLLGPVQSSLTVLGWLLPQLNTLIDTLDAVYADERDIGLNFGIRDSIDDLQDWKVRPWLGPSNFNFFTMRWDNEATSAVLLGPPGRQARLFNDKFCRVGQGRLDLTAGRELLVRVDNLNGPAPVGDPSAGATVARPASSFGGSLNSFCFAWTGA